MDLDLARVALGLGFFSVAAAMDWRRRIVEDGVWIAMGAVSLGVGQFDMILTGLPPYLHLMGLATGILYFGVFFGKPIFDEDGFHLRPPRFALYVLVAVIVVLVWRRSEYDPGALGAFWRLLTMPAMIVVAHGMYEFGLLRGGADAKAVMALALLFPGLYPILDPFPLLRPASAAAPTLAVVFPFAFVVLVNSALLLLVVPLAFLARNLAAGDVKLPRALFGYRVPVDRVPKYAWLMDRIEGGRAVRAYFPRHTEDREVQLRLLREHGFGTVWVTPQLPFVTAMLVGLVLAVVVGNPLLALFGAFGG